MISDMARPHYTKMVDELRNFYIKEGQFLNEDKLFTEVCLRFGDRLLAEVCPHLDLEMGECTAGAIEFMREAAQHR